jgi:hypothetical protein
MIRKMSMLLKITKKKKKTHKSKKTRSKTDSKNYLGLSRNRRMLSTKLKISNIKLLILLKKRKMSRKLLKTVMLLRNMQTANTTEASALPVKEMVAENIHGTVELCLMGSGRTTSNKALASNFGQMAAAMMEYG